MLDDEQINRSASTHIFFILYLNNANAVQDLIAEGV